MLVSFLAVVVEQKTILIEPINLIVVFFEFIYRPVFRSYRPLDEDLKEGELKDASPGEVTEHVKEELEKENEGIQIDKLVRFLIIY